MEVFVLVELDDDYTSIICVCDSPKTAEQLMLEYYGGAVNVIDYRDVRDSGIEWYKTIETIEEKPQKVILVLKSFNFNEL